MDRSRMGRGVAILAVAALAMAVVSPAFSAAPLTKAKVKKIAKKVANKQINAKVPGMVTGIGDPRYINVGEDSTLGVVTAQDYKYASPQTNRLVVPAPQFVPDSAGNPVWEYGGYSGSVGCETSGCTFEAPVVLPPGAVVTQIEWTYGNGSAGVSSFHFERNFGDFDHDDVITGDNDECLTAPCTKTFPISGGHTVDPDSHYGIYLPQGDGFYTFKFVIEYTTTAVGPATGRVAADGGSTGSPGNHGGP